MKNYLSIDIGGTKIKYAELDHAGNIITKGKVDSSHDKDEFLAIIDKIVAQYSAKGTRGVAFCAPGKIEHTKIHFGGALPFLDGIDFAQRYKDLNAPIAVINDGKASVLAENWLGSLKGMKNCAAITLGTAVGGGIIANGRLLNGAHFQAGEFSFLKLKTDGNKMDNFSGYVASAVGMIQRINEKLGNPDKKDGLAAFKAINDGNPDALKIFQDFCKLIVSVIIDIQAVVDLDAIAIGGGISAQPIVVQEINKQYDKLYEDNSLVKMTLTRPQILDAKFKNDANLYGALYNLLVHANGEKL